MSDRYVPSPDRYKGQPFHRVLDSFVLWVIGVPDEKSVATMEALTPKFLKTFGMERGTWQDVVMQQMEFEDEYVEWLRTKWLNAVALDLEHGRLPDPLAWAHATVDFIVRDDPNPPP